MSVLNQTSANPKPQPSAGTAPKLPAPQRIDMMALLPKSLPAMFAEALTTAGWSFNVSTVALTNKTRTASLDSLPFEFEAWLNTRREYPSFQRLDAMKADIRYEVLRVLPRTGGLLS